MYVDGTGVDRDLAKAIAHLERACTGELETGCRRLASLYEDEKLGLQNPALARQMHRRAIHIEASKARARGERTVWFGRYVKGMLAVDGLLFELGLLSRVERLPEALRPAIDLADEHGWKEGRPWFADEHDSDIHLPTERPKKTQPEWNADRADFDCRVWVERSVSEHTKYFYSAPLEISVEESWTAECSNRPQDVGRWKTSYLLESRGTSGFDDKQREEDMMRALRDIIAPKRGPILESVRTLVRERLQP
jgi:hypothetical protein